MEEEVKDIKLKYRNNEWKEKPIAITNWDYKICDYVMFIDENNSNSALNNVKKKILTGKDISQDERFFTITGCIFTQQNYIKAKYKFNNLKRKYWEDGKWINPKGNKEENICFHSIEIRNRKNAFSLIDNYNDFIEELDTTIKDTDYKIISISIDLIEYVLNTSYDFDVYDIAFDFLLERYIYEIKDGKGLVMLEARGKKEDKKLLEHITRKINDGFYYISKKSLEKIVGIYFNPKFNSSTNLPIIGLEIADLSSYPIHKFIKYGKKDLAFKTLEKKLRNYPNYLGKGLKVYPQTKNNNNIIQKKVDIYQKN